MIINNFFSFLFGCCFGSFINVLVYRLPIGESILFPGSKCTKCNRGICWYDNIPILSWIFLKGKCRKCNKKISFIYPVIEILTGLLFVLNNYSMPSRFFLESQTITTFCGWFFISILLTMSILDIKHLWLPSIVCNIGIAFAICLSILIELRYLQISSYLLISETIFTAFLGYLFFQFIRLIGLKIYKKPAMGEGDAKLAALIGSWLGFKGLCISTWLAFNLAGLFAIIGLITRKLKKDQKIPFGSFLSLSGLCVWYFGNHTLTSLIFLGR